MSNNLTDRTRVRIPLTVAIQRTRNWRNFLSQNFKTLTKKELPKAVYMSRQDIADLHEMCEKNLEIVGMRAYFTLNTPQAEDFGKNEIRFVMVAVRFDQTKQYGTDIVHGEKIHDLADDDTSDVYDYTRPCPDCCDPDSPLSGN